MDDQSGFTFFEVVLVLILIAVLTAVVVSRNSGSAAQAKLRGQADLLKSQLRYAQARSLNATQVWGMEAQNDKLWLFNGGDDTNQVILPGEGVSPVAYNAGNLNNIKVDDFIVSFDDLGQPYGSADAASNLLSAPLIFNVSDVGSGASVQVSITPHTGFIQ